jgi:MinD superfamily P-loop ATPase
MIIAIASGKGGTGKTTFAVNLAQTLLQKDMNIRLLDCDVEEPNVHLFIKPKFTDEKSVNVFKPVWDSDKCTGCGKCTKACSYNALAMTGNNLLIFNELCHSCGLCTFICPQNAIHEESVKIGKIQISDENKSFFFAHGLLNIGEPLAPKVVKAVKQYIDQTSINIIDASPGIACPVVEAVEGSDVTVLVTEPTPFGLYDLKLAVNLMIKMKIPVGIVINCSDGKDDLIVTYAEKAGIPIIGRIPFKKAYAEAYSKGDILINVFPDLKEEFLKIFKNIKKLVGTKISPKLIEEPFIVQKKKTESLKKEVNSNHKELVVISGKGGTGKTTVLASLAVLASDSVLADNDVDASDLHLLLKPKVYEKNDFYGGSEAVIDQDKCIGCGKCAQSCHFNAIDVSGTENKIYTINELACEGCHLCKYVCPKNAITIKEKITGQLFISETEYGQMVHARLGIAEENSGKLVSLVRNHASKLAQKLKKGNILGDGPPGTSCPVIASISGADLVLIVTEPTISGIHDMERVIKLVSHFRIPAKIVINKANLNADQTDRIYKIAKKENLSVVAEIPFDRNVYEALIACKTVVEWGKGSANQILKQLWNTLKKELFYDF